MKDKEKTDLTIIANLSSDQIHRIMEVVHEQPEEPPEQPKPLLSDAQVGDIVKLRNGEYVQLTKYHKVLSLCHPWEASNGVMYAVSGSSYHDAAISSDDIISCEPLAAEGTLDRAIQEMKLGKKMYNPLLHVWGTSWSEYDAERNEIVTLNHNGRTAIYRSLSSPYPAVATGWQIYEPKPKPIADCNNCKYGCSKQSPNIDHCVYYDPKYEVGDWVLVAGGKQGKIDHFCSDDLFQDNSNAFVLHDYMGRWFGYHKVSSILRKLDPSEVKVTLSLEGTVRIINDLYFSLNPSKEVGWVVPEATIPLEMLSPSQAEMVRELTETGGGE